MALPDDIFKTINDHARRIFNLESNPQPPNIGLSNDASAVFDLAPGTYVLITVTLNDVQGGRMLAMPTFSLYKDNDIDAATLYPSGGDWGDSEVTAVNIFNWLDWGTSDNSDVKLKVLIANNTLANYTDLLFRVNWRYLTREVSLS